MWPHDINRFLSPFHLIFSSLFICFYLHFLYVFFFMFSSPFGTRVSHLYMYQFPQHHDYCHYPTLQCVLGSHLGVLVHSFLSRISLCHSIPLRTRSKAIDPDPDPPPSQAFVPGVAGARLPGLFRFVIPPPRDAAHPCIRFYFLDL